MGLQDSDSKSTSQLDIIRVSKSLWRVLMLTRKAVHPKEPQLADNTAEE